MAVHYRNGSCSQALSRSPTQSPLRPYICGWIQGARRSLPRSFVIHSSEGVSDFIRRLEKTFLVAYGRDDWNTATRDVLLYGQLYEGLRYDIMLSPAVSGSHGYWELATAAKGEERRLAALKQRQLYSKTASHNPTMQPRTTRSTDAQPTVREGTTATPVETDLRKCYRCGKAGYLANKCSQRRQESQGQSTWTKQVQSQPQSQRKNNAAVESTLDALLLSSSEDEESTKVNTVHITDSGSVTQCVRVQVQGVPAYGLIDSGVDIIIIGGSLFKKVATVARLKQCDLKKADRIPRTYDQQPFTLDGRMNLEVTFGDKQMTTTVYIHKNGCP